MKCNNIKKQMSLEFKKKPKGLTRTLVATDRNPNIVQVNTKRPRHTNKNV